MPPADVAMSASPILVRAMAILAIVILLSIFLSMVAIRFFVSHEAAKRRRLNWGMVILVYVISMLGFIAYLNPTFNIPRREVAVEKSVNAVLVDKQPDRPVWIRVEDNESIMVAAGGLEWSHVKRSELIAAVNTLTNEHKDQRIFFRPAPNLSMEQVSPIMNLLAEAGYTKLALVRPNSEQTGSEKQ